MHNAHTKLCKGVGLTYGSTEELTALCIVQVHMYMEPQTAVAKWDEGGVIQLTSSTQSTDHVQWAVSAALNLPQNKVNVHCRRAGGGFGGKFSRSRPAACAVAVAAYKLRRQVRPSPCYRASKADRACAHCQLHTAVSRAAAAHKMGSYNDLTVPHASVSAKASVAE